MATAPQFTKAQLFEFRSERSQLGLINDDEMLRQAMRVSGISVPAHEMPDALKLIRSGFDAMLTRDTKATNKVLKKDAAEAERKGEPLDVEASAEKGQVRAYRKSGDAQDQICGCCGKTPQEVMKLTFQVCQRCSVQRYCSRDCQIGHWKVHKIDCTAG